jgi:opacity protein-like surface antigen
MKRALLIMLFAIIFGSLAAQAQNIQPHCVSGCGPDPGANPGVNPNNGFYQLGYAFGQWLFGGGSRSNAADEALRQQQQQEMMAELRRREQEAERQHREEEARRLAAMYNRLASTLKLVGLPHLQMKSSGTAVGGLQIKLGDNAQGYGIAGLPGIYTGGPGSGSGQTSQTGSKLQLKMGDGATGGGQAPDNGQQGYGIQGLPGIYTGGPGSGSALPPPSQAGLQLKTGDGAAASTTPAAGASGTPDFNKMTPQQLADAADAFSKLPPEEQQRAMTAGQNGPLTPQQVPAPPAKASTAEQMNGAPGSQPAQATTPVMTPQTAAQPVTSLQQRANASQAAATAKTPEEASINARAGFDTPLGSMATPPATAPTFGQPRSASPQAPASAPTVNPRTAPPASRSTPSLQANAGQPVTPSAASTTRETPSGIGRQYTYAGNGLIGGTTWTLYASRKPGEPEQRMCDVIKQQSKLAGSPYSEGADCKRYDFVLGMAVSVDAFTDLNNRVAFDDLTNGQFSAHEQGLYGKLRGKQFDELGCHSNGAMICLAALENKDIKADHVVLYGPQVTRESLKMWDQLVRDGQVKSVKVYINENDPVPGASIAYADFKRARVLQVAGAEAPLFEIDSLKRTINEISPRLLVQTFPCARDRHSLECHVLSMYQSKVNCTGKSSGEPVPGTALHDNGELPEPPLPCDAIGSKP